MTRTIWQVYRKALKIDADIYHFHDPELIPVGIALRFKGHKVIYDVHEDVPETIREKYWLPGWLRMPVSGIISLIEKVGAKYFDAVVPATPKIGERFNPGCTVLVQNFPHLSELTVSKPRPYLERSNVFVFVGGLTRRRGAREMVKAIDRVPDSCNAKMILIGSLRPPELEQELELLRGWSKTEFRGWGSRDEVATQFDQSRAGLVLFHPGPNHMEAQPNKLFEYMSAGLPVIASDFPLWRLIIGKSRCGLLVNPLDHKTISEAMQWMLDNPDEAMRMGQRGRQAVENRYNWESESEKLLALYSKLSPLLPEK